ncbi:MAG: FAD-dependent oxidoreductase [Ruminococcaceae bacterium]|nr:FAD-dependent oxidoreductase [Oscillospiraceae bacterium]
MQPLSVWHKTAELPSFPKAEGDLQTDVLIIGGGIAGLLTAYRLHKSGIRCMLVEKKRICSGTTGNTTAKISVQHGIVYSKIMKEYGLSAAKIYLNANQAALDSFFKICEELQIDCDLERRDSFLYSRTYPKDLISEYRALERIGCPCDFSEKTELPFPVRGVIRIPNQAQFHPLKFLSAICRDLPIYENTFVREMIGTTAVTDRAKIRAEKVIVCTHFPFLNKHGAFFLKLYQHRSYVIALEGAKTVSGMYLDEEKTGLSFRSYQNLLLLGGGGHRTGKSGGNWEVLRKFAKRHYPETHEIAHWAAQDCMSLDSIPYVGYYSKQTPDLYAATGFNKWGMTGAMVASALLCDLILKKRNVSKYLYDPSRQILHPQLFLNGLEAAADLLVPLPHRCPHLGCALRWNADERSWDCACHGSRFSENGTILDNPANGNLKIR